jgi:hypothetical protein
MTRKTTHDDSIRTPLVTRRGFGAAGAGTALSLMLPKGAGAAPFTPAPSNFDRSLMPSFLEVLESILLVNSAMGPTRLTGSPQHSAFVNYMADKFAEAGLIVGRDTYTFPRWTATSWGIKAGNKSLDVSSYYPHSNGFYSGKRDANGNYPNSGITQPVTTATGTVVNLGTWNGKGSVPWANAAGKIAYIDYPTPSFAFPLSTWYKVLELYNSGASDTFPSSSVGPISSILAGVDLNNAAAAGVLGVIVGWQGVSNGNAEGQYNPFTETLQGGGPALWVNSDTAAEIKSKIAGTNTKVTLTLDASIQVVPTSTVYATLPGANYGKPNDEIIINNTHSDGPNITEENGGIGLVHLARYFSRVPQSKRPKTMVFMASTGHFSAGFLGSGADFIAFHPDIIDKTVAVLTIEHLGCKDYQDIQRGANLVYEPTGKLTQGWAFGPNGQAAQIMENALPGSLNRLAVLSLNSGSGAPFFGEGAHFNSLGIPTIGYIPVPQWLCAIAADGQISKISPENFYSQLEIFAKCLTVMQETPAATLAG